VVSRLPIRIRLTLGFVAAFAVMLAAGGLLLYARFEAGLNDGIDQSLHAQLAEVTALTRQADTGLRQGGIAPRGDTVAQVLAPSGAVVDWTPGLGTTPILTRRQLRGLTGTPQRFEVAALPAFGGPARLLAATVPAQDGRLVIVVGAPLTDRNGALGSLRTELLVGGPLALFVVGVAGYLLARAALAPVERLRRETDRLQAGQLARGVAVPKADDEIRRLGETLNAMLGRLDASLQRERRFVADASHELRTPLALLKAELDLALRRPRSLQELEAAVRSAAAETERVVRLAEDLLVLARADATGLPISRSPTRVGHLLGRVERRFAERAQQAGRTVVGRARDVPPVSIDPVRMEQALGNLVDNALRYGDGEVTLAAAVRDGTIELTVGDEGPGFPETFLPDAFERFSRPEGERREGGFGLGLSLVAAVATAHGGRVSAGNRAQGGAEVTISLPLVPTASASGQTDDESPSGAGLSGDVARNRSSQPAREREAQAHTGG
jgi:signal transduction histidine kinase